MNKNIAFFAKLFGICEDKCRLKHGKGTRAKEEQSFDQMSTHLQSVSSIFKVCASKSVYLYKKPLLSKGIQICSRTLYLTKVNL